MVETTLPVRRSVDDEGLGKLYVAESRTSKGSVKQAPLGRMTVKRDPEGSAPNEKRIFLEEGSGAPREDVPKHDSGAFQGTYRSGEEYCRHGAG